MKTRFWTGLLLVFGCLLLAACSKKTTKPTEKHPKPATTPTTPTALGVWGAPRIVPADAELIAVADLSSLLRRAGSIYASFHKAVNAKDLPRFDEILSKMTERLGVDLRKLGRVVVFARDSGSQLLCAAGSSSAVALQRLTADGSHLGVKLWKGRGVHGAVAGNWVVLCASAAQVREVIEVFKGQRPAFGPKAPNWKEFSDLNRSLTHTWGRLFVVGRWLTRIPEVKSLDLKALAISADLSKGVSAIAILPTSGMTRVEGMVKKMTDDAKAPQVVANMRTLAKDLPPAYAGLGIDEAIKTINTAAAAMTPKRDGNRMSMTLAVSFDHAFRIMLVTAIPAFLRRARRPKPVSHP